MHSKINLRLLFSDKLFPAKCHSMHFFPIHMEIRFDNGDKVTLENTIYMFQYLVLFLSVDDKSL